MPLPNHPFPKNSAPIGDIERIVHQGSKPCPLVKQDSPPSFFSLNYLNYQTDPF